MLTFLSFFLKKKKNNKKQTNQKAHLDLRIFFLSLFSRQMFIEYVLNQFHYSSLIVIEETWQHTMNECPQWKSFIKL